MSPPAPPDARLLHSLIREEKAYVDALAAAVRHAHSASASLSAWGTSQTSSSPHLASVASAITSLLNDVAEAQGVHVRAIDGYREALKDVEEREQSLRTVVRDRDILVTRLIKASKKKPNKSDLRHGPTLDGDTAHAEKLADAQRELEACEAVLRNEMIALEGVKRRTFKEALTMRMKCMGDAGAVMQDAAREAILLLDGVRTDANAYPLPDVLVSNGHFDGVGASTEWTGHETATARGGGELKRRKTIRGAGAEAIRKRVLERAHARLLSLERGEKEGGTSMKKQHGKKKEGKVEDGKEDGGELKEVKENRNEKEKRKETGEEKGERKKGENGKERIMAPSSSLEQGWPTRMRRVTIERVDPPRIRSKRGLDGGTSHFLESSSLTPFQSASQVLPNNHRPPSSPHDSSNAGAPAAEDVDDGEASETDSNEDYRRAFIEPRLGIPPPHMLDEDGEGARGSFLPSSRVDHSRRDSQSQGQGQSQSQGQVEIENAHKQVKGLPQTPPKKMKRKKKKASSDVGVVRPSASERGADGSLPRPKAEYKPLSTLTSVTAPGSALLEPFPSVYAASPLRRGGDQDDETTDEGARFAAKAFGRSHHRASASVAVGPSLDVTPRRGVASASSSSSDGRTGAKGRGGGGGRVRTTSLSFWEGISRAFSGKKKGGSAVDGYRHGHEDRMHDSGSRWHTRTDERLEEIKAEERYLAATSHRHQPHRLSQNWHSLTAGGSGTGDMGQEQDSSEEEERENRHLIRVVNSKPLWVNDGEGVGGGRLIRRPKSTVEVGPDGKPVKKRRSKEVGGGVKEKVKPKRELKEKVEKEEKGEAKKKEKEKERDETRRADGQEAVTKEAKGGGAGVLKKAKSSLSSGAKTKRKTVEKAVSEVGTSSTKVARSKEKKGAAPILPLATGAGGENGSRTTGEEVNENRPKSLVPLPPLSAPLGARPSSVAMTPSASAPDATTTARLGARTPSLRAPGSPASVPIERRKSVRLAPDTKFDADADNPDRDMGRFREAQGRAPSHLTRSVVSTGAEREKEKRKETRARPSSSPRSGWTTRIGTTSVDDTSSDDGDDGGHEGGGAYARARRALLATGTDAFAAAGAAGRR